MSLSPMRPAGYAAPMPAAGYYQAPPVVAPPVAMPAMPPASTPAARPGIAALGRAAMTGSALPPGASPFETRVLGLVQSGQAAMGRLANTIFPPRPTALANTPLTLTEKLQKVGRAAIFFALPVGGAAAVACLFGWLVGPLVPFVGGHVFGAAVGAFAIGETAGGLLHGAMRLPLVTNPQDRELNSAGATVASAALGAGFAGVIALAAGAPVTVPLLLGGAALGAVPRIIEWGLGKL